LAIRSAADPLLRLTADADPHVRRASLDSLLRLEESRAVPPAVAALSDRATQMTALECLGRLGGPQQADAVIALAKDDPSNAVVSLAAQMLTKWSSQANLSASQRTAMDRAVAEIQAVSGLLALWRVTGPASEDIALKLRERLPNENRSADPDSAAAPQWRAAFAASVEGHVQLGNPSPGIWLAYADLDVAEPTTAQFLASAEGKFQVWLNGRRIYERSESRDYQPDSDRFDAALPAGTSRVVVQVAASAAQARFHLRFRRKSSTAEMEKLVQAALTRKGDIDRGRQVFMDAKAQCSRCHRVQDQGERIGPDLAALGDRFSRIHIVESILEPSRTVTPGFQAVTVRLLDGRVLTGVRISETDAVLVLADQQGQKHTLVKNEIEAQKLQSQSMMPDGLVKQLTVDQFVDLVAFLANQRAAPAAQ
jgi:putative heme-binding domain-containing protein